MHGKLVVLSQSHEFQRRSWRAHSMHHFVLLFMIVLVTNGIYSSAHGGEDFGVSYEEPSQNTISSYSFQPSEDGSSVVFARGLTDVLTQLERLRIVSSININIPLNFVFIGFSGDGEHNFTVAKEELDDWFAHIDHSLKHTRVPYREGGVDTEKIAGLDESHVNYRYKYNVVQTAPSVARAFQKAITLNMRRDGISNVHSPHSHGKTIYYVDPTRIEQMLKCLLSTIELKDSFSVVIMNPKIVMPSSSIHVHEDEETDVRVHYGYRVGFGSDDLDMLALGEQDGEVGEGKFSDPTDVHIIEDNDEGNSVDYYSVSAEWGNQHETELDMWQRTMNLLDDIKEPGVQSEPRRYIDKILGKGKQREEENENDIQEFPKHTCIRFPIGSNKLYVEDVAHLLEVGGTYEEKRHVFMARHGYSVQSDCLVDNWVSGHGKLAFVDLSAGPFEWGPSSGADGVRTMQTLPRIRDAVFGRKEPPIATEPITHDSSEGNTEGKEARKEREIVQSFYDKFCNPLNIKEGKEVPEYCLEVVSRINRLKAEEMDSAYVATKDDIRYADSGIISGSTLEGINEQVELNRFLGQLSAAASVTLKHLVTPSSPSFRSFYADRIIFNLYFAVGHTKFKVDAIENFDVSAFKREMKKFQLPGQEFEFVVHRLMLPEDPTLSQAYSKALKTAVLPTLDAKGRFVAKKRIYVDSAVLADHLKNQFVHKHKKTKPGTSAGRVIKHALRSAVKSREVPVFIFSAFFQDLPVFIDKYYQAKALKHMVLAVQSPLRSWQGTMACSGNIRKINLRNPLKMTLAATALHLTGLIPSHIGVSCAHSSAVQNWVWSVGSRPTSYTSGSHSFSPIDIDNGHRAWLINALDTSAELVNSAVLGLRKSVSKHFGSLNHGTENGGKSKIDYNMLKDRYPGLGQSGLDLVKLHHSISNQWEEITRQIQSNSKAELSSALKQTTILLDDSRTFQTISRQIGEHTLSEAVCDAVSVNFGQEGDYDSWITWLIVLVNVGIFSLLLLQTRRKVKVKIN